MNFRMLLSPLWISARPEEWSFLRKVQLQDILINNSVRIVYSGLACLHQQPTNFILRNRRLNAASFELLQYIFIHSQLSYSLICLKSNSTNVRKSIDAQLVAMAQNESEIMMTAMIPVEDYGLGMTQAYLTLASKILSIRSGKSVKLSFDFMLCLSIEVWITLLVFVMLCITANAVIKIHCDEKLNISNLVWSYFGIVFSEPFKDPRSVPETVVILSWLLGVFFVVANLGSVLASTFTISSEQNIDSFRDLRDKPDLTILTRIKEPFFQASEEIDNVPISYFKNRIKIKDCAYFHHCIGLCNIFATKQSVIFDYDLSINRYMTCKCENPEKPEWYVGESTISMNFLIFFYRKETPWSYVEDMNIRICRYVETSQGMLNEYRILRRVLKNTDPFATARTDAQYSIIHLIELGSIFAVWLSGMAIAILSLLVENLIFAVHLIQNLVKDFV